MFGAALALMAFGLQFWQWREQRFVRESVRTLLAGRDIGPERRFGAPAGVRLAYALYLAGREEYREAEELLAELGQVTSSDIGAKAVYDLGNVYLSRAIAAVERDATAQAGTLAELAKQAYRQALRRRPDDWAAKYNYEVAARLMPDFDRIDNVTEEPEPDEESARKLWTRVPGFPRGLP
jgi:mxaK protein